METLVKGEGALFIKREVTEGVHVAPTSADDAVEPLTDGLEFTLEREEIERNTLSNTVEAVEPRLGRKTVTGAIPIEFKAGKEEGAYPRGADLYESLFGGKHLLTTRVTTKAGNTTTVLQIEDADISKFKVGMCILVLEAGKFEVRPISEIDDTPGSANIVLPIALKNIPSDNVQIAKCLTYFHDKATPAFSAENFLGGKIKEVLTGFKAISAAIENWTVWSTPSINFSVEGLDVSREVGDTPFVPDFSEDAQVPVINHACAWIGQNEVDYTELTASFENTKADLESACAPSGKIGSRKTAFNTTASINPYMSGDDVTRWDNFQNNVNTSLFTYAFNPSETEGEFSQVVALWLPNVKIINMPTGDTEGVLIDQIEFKAFKKKGNDTVFMSFI